MTAKDFQLQQLRKLCEAQGGHEVVSAAIGASSAYLWQLLNGTKLPSGESRGVGNRMARKLSTAYPDWLASTPGGTPDTEETSATRGAQIERAVELLAVELSKLSPAMREAVSASLAAWAREGGASHWSIAIQALLNRSYECKKQ